jgi:TonB family protein
VRVYVVALLAALLPAVGCVTRTTTYYTPTAGASRLTTDEFRDQGDRYVGALCPRLMGGGQSAGGEAELVLEIDRASGDVTRARLARSSGDSQVDDVLGELASRLRFEPPSDAPGRGATVEARVGAGYACAPGRATVTLRLPGETATP